METVSLQINAAGATERTFQGRKYWVVNLSMLKPGVLPGSKGPLYYPPEEVLRSVQKWDSMPIVVNHPMKDGNPIKARSPEVLEKQGIGYVFNSRFDDGLKADGWFDQERTAAIEPRIADALKTGQRMELSTGLFTKNEPASGEAVHNGIRYTHVARQYDPDHLAILPDSRGACSLNEGCGLNVNHNPTPTEENKMKEALITQLVTNCECWTEADRPLLQNQTEDQLKRLILAAGFKQPATPTPAATPVANTQPAQPAAQPVQPVTPVAQPAAQQPVVPVTNTQPLTAEQWMAQAPEPVRQMVANAQHVEMTQKQRIASLLVNHITDAAATQATYTDLMKESLPSLQRMERLIPSAKPVVANSFDKPLDLSQPQQVVNYDLGGMHPLGIYPPSQPTNNGLIEDEDPLLPPSLVG
jgi:hypothetical protein